MLGDGQVRISQRPVGKIKEQLSEARTLGEVFTRSDSLYQFPTGVIQQVRRNEGLGNLSHKVRAVIIPISVSASPAPAFLEILLRISQRIA